MCDVWLSSRLVPYMQLVDGAEYVWCAACFRQIDTAYDWNACTECNLRIHSSCNRSPHGLTCCGECWSYE